MWQSFPGDQHFCCVLSETSLKGSLHATRWRSSVQHVMQLLATLSLIVPRDYVIACIMEITIKLSEKRDSIITLQHVVFTVCVIYVIVTKLNPTIHIL